MFFMNTKYVLFYMKITSPNMDARLRVQFNLANGQTLSEAQVRNLHCKLRPYVLHAYGVLLVLYFEV